jgi:hypothetical protein
MISAITPLISRIQRKPRAIAGGVSSALPAAV